MYSVRTLPEFDAWLRGLADKTVQRRLVVRLRKAALGNLGDVKSVGHGISEMREHFGAGWRMYFVMRDGQLVVMLGGGAKSSQSRDIATARQRAQRIAWE
jgi:putative addiction module killer protein